MEKLLRAISCKIYPVLLQNHSIPANVKAAMRMDLVLEACNQLYPSEPDICTQQ